jgi:type II secretory pathway pseudopilin PulG
MMLEIVSTLAEILVFVAVLGGLAAIAVLIWAVSTERGDE